MKTIFTAGVVLALGTVAAHAQIKPVVPEIDAVSGVAALAAVGASIALLRERFKR